MTIEIQNQNNGATIQTPSRLNLHPDVKAKVESKKWFYTDTVKEHFFNPRNILMNDDEGNEYEKSANGVGMVGSPACIAGNTLIAVADDRKFVKIKQLAEEDKNVPVYCYGEDKIQIRMARFFRKTRENTIIWKVTLDDNSSFRATPDHSVMLPDGSYKMINELKAGDCLMPFNDNLINYDNGEVQLIKTNNLFRKINSIDFFGYEDVYNTTVDDFHNYVIITNKNKLSGAVIKNCGDAMKIWIKADKENDKIIECKFNTYGCASALASTSMLTVMVTENGGMKIDDALKLKPQDIMNRLGGLPNRKFHCSVLGDKALRSAVNDYFRRSGQNSRIIVEGARIIDPDTKTTDKDIEETVLEGALTFEDVQKKLKVGISNKAVIPAVEELIKFYKEKYFG